MRFTQQQTRTYIAEQAAELAKLAAGVKLKEAARLLELAALQANNGSMAHVRCDGVSVHSAAVRRALSPG